MLIWWFVGGLIGGHGFTLVAMAVVVSLRYSSTTVAGLSPYSQKIMILTANVIPFGVLSLMTLRAKEKKNMISLLVGYVAAVVFIGTVILFMD